jgi:hypothetical protein
MPQDTLSISRSVENPNVTPLTPSKCLRLSGL